MTKKQILLLLIFIYTAISVSAQHEAHEHEVGEMEIVVEKEQAEIILHIPGSDFIGFEHTELNDEEKKMIHERIELIQSTGNEMISFRTRRWMKVQMNELHIEEAGHEEEGHEEEDGEHTEYELHFNFSMDDSFNLRDMDLKELFSVFPTLSEIQWIMISETGQTAGKVSPSNSRIPFQ